MGQLFYKEKKVKKFIFFKIFKRSNNYMKSAKIGKKYIKAVDLQRFV